MTSRFSTLGELNAGIIGCRMCPRLVEFRSTVLIDSGKYRKEDFWRKPVIGFGDHGARLMVVGLAPAASGANRTGRVFTGDRSSDVLVSAFHTLGLSNLSRSLSVDDGLEYHDLYLTLAVRCVPPDNRPSKDEIVNCLPFLESEMNLLPAVRSIVALGTIAFNSMKEVLKNRGNSMKNAKFRHGSHYDVEGMRLYACYHPSPRNINTGRTSREDIVGVLKRAYDYAIS